MGKWCVRRAAQFVVTAFLATIGLIAVTPPASACACGGVVNPPGETTAVTQETALITRHGGQETIVMSLSARSDATKAGLLVPTPKPATPALADRSVFTDLSEQTTPRQRTRHHLFGPPVLFGGTDDSSANGAAPQSAAPTGVHVLSAVDLGPLRAVSLTAGNAGDLHTWLDKHGFVMSRRFEALVTPYLDKGWAFTAMTLTPKGKSLSGDLPPVSLRFASDKLVYPMRMSRGAKETQRVTTYVLADHRVARTDPTARQGDLRTTYADRVDTSKLTSPTLQQLAVGEPWLTEMSQVFDDPGAQVRSDFTFTSAAHDTPVVSYYYTDDYLIPGDIAVLLVILLGAVAGGVATFVIRRRATPVTA
ncbi:DUF2330 domain-containing protein [Flexivirga oryzae]|uniref:DUF2330 domain-containing protein n=1 Tax=Flexivirga oryzae TaxID=1794944 RepID=A0A839NAU7_9MICO|nr:DUF2330 domain-containing protein [Flexivirga oryzae]MBB2892335.1 hypothetical protein [Flexivirga oryzae]